MVSRANYIFSALGVNPAQTDEPIFIMISKSEIMIKTAALLKWNKLGIGIFADETGCVTAPAELGTKSAWSSSNPSDLVLYSLAVILVLLVILLAGYKVTRQRFVSLHHDQSQTVRKHSIVIRLGFKETDTNIFFHKLSKLSNLLN